MPNFFDVSSCPDNWITYSNGECFRTEGGYNNEDFCQIFIQQDVYLDVIMFDTEGNYHDNLVVNGIYYSGSHGPQGVFVASNSMMERLTFTADNSNTGDGIDICGSTSAITDDSDSGSLVDNSFSLGSCGNDIITYANGACFKTDGDYNNNGICWINVQQNCYLNVTMFDTEYDRDFLVLNGDSYSGGDRSESPHGVYVADGELIEFEPDNQNTGSGFDICCISSPVNVPFFMLDDCGDNWSTFRNGECFTTSVRGYDDWETCSIYPQRDLYLDVIKFDTYDDRDALIVNNVWYHGSKGPQGVFVASGERFWFQADQEHTGEGLAICGYTATTDNSGSGSSGNDTLIYIAVACGVVGILAVCFFAYVCRMRSVKRRREIQLELETQSPSV